MNQGYPAILSIDSDAYGEGGVAVETFEGRKKMFLCTSTPRATPLPKVTRRARAWAVEMGFIEELKEIRGCEVFFLGMAVSRPKCSNKLSSVLGGWQ